jgi:hypothetical protein
VPRCTQPPEGSGGLPDQPRQTSSQSSTGLLTWKSLPTVTPVRPYLNSILHRSTNFTELFYHVNSLLCKYGQRAKAQNHRSSRTKQLTMNGTPHTKLRSGTASRAPSAASHRAVHCRPETLVVKSSHYSTGLQPGRLRQHMFQAHERLSYTRSSFLPHAIIPKPAPGPRLCLQLRPLKPKGLS